MASILEEVLKEVEAEAKSAPRRPPQGVPPSRRKRKPESVLTEIEEEAGAETTPTSVLTEVEREEDIEPTSVRKRRAAGETLTAEQQRVAFEAERARPLADVALGATGAFLKAVPETVGQIVRGAGKLGYEGVAGVGEAALSGLIYEPGSAEQEAAVRRGLGRPASALRSVASGVAQDIEETANAATRAAMFGTSMTDRAAEAAGLIDNEKSFQNYLNREEMRKTEARDIQENPDRASTLLARNPLAGTVIQAASIATGQGTLSPEAEKAAVDEYHKIMTEEAQSFTPDEDLSMLGEIVSPVGLPARLVGPVTRATGGTMEAIGGGLIRVATKPTVKGVNPLEGVGIGIRKIGEGAEAVGAKVSEAITGRPDTFLASPAALVSAFTKRPGELIEGTGRTFRDIGRQIDAGGIRGRTGLIERLGRDPQSADWIRDLFGPGSQARLDRIAKKNIERIELGKPEIKLGQGGIMRARAADYSLRTANALSKAGVSGAALNGIIGAADIETAEEFGQAAGVGFGIGGTMRANIPGKVEAILDPTKTVAQRIDKFLEVDPLDRRLDEDADLKRFRATADPEILKKVETLASPEEQINAVQRDINELIQLKAQAEDEGKDTADLDVRLTIAQENLASLQDSTSRMTQADRDERRRQVELIVADALDLFKTTGRAAGLNGIDVRILSPEDFEGFLREKWGKNLQDAEAIVAQLGNETNLSESEENSLRLARETVQEFQNEVTEFPTAMGFAMADSLQEDRPAHLQKSNIGAPTMAVSAETVMRFGADKGLRHVLQHEGMHVLEEFREVQEMQQPIRELWFGKTVTQPDGTTVEVQPGIITDDWIDTTGVKLYGRLTKGGEAGFRSRFDSPERMREYIRKELLAELSGISESGYNTIREGLDSAGQAIVDRILISSKNSLLGRARAALEAMGIELDGQGNVQSVIFGREAPFNPEALALMRQFKRQLRDFNDTLTYAAGDSASDVTITIPELMTNRALQEAYKDDVIWEKELVVNVYDDDGNLVAEIPAGPNATTDNLIGEYRLQGGRYIDKNGNAFDLTPGVDISGLPDGSRVEIDNRIARNPDGSPKILTNKEIKARARLRDKLIKDAIDNAPDDGFKNRLRDTGNGSYRGVMSLSQVQAILALPNDVVPPSLKRNIVAFNEILRRKDGTRILMEYQPALRGGKYRALAPKIRDVVPIGFQFSKQGNFLATTISVSRMFDKMNLWAQKKPERLNLWGRDLGRFWEDVTRVLDNHNQNLPGQTNLDIDPVVAMEKKNIINDFFNLFNKDTEAANPDRTKLPSRRGQDSPDRIIMSARMDRINQMQVSNADKVPVDYGKMTVNFFPAEEGRAMRLDQFQDPEIENDITGGPGTQFLPGIRYTQLPDDPKKLMADFYLLNAMTTTPPTGWSLGKFGGEPTMYAPSKDPTGRYAGARAEVYEEALNEAKQTLIPQLHEKIQKALHFAIAAELRHALSRKQPTELASSDFWQEYARQYAIQGSTIPDLKKPRAPRRFAKENEGYVNSFTAMENARKKLGMSVTDVAKFAEQMFRTGVWSSAYGGNPWGDIAQHLAEMTDPSYSTERVRAVETDENGRLRIVETNEFRDPQAFNQMFQEIDRAYDLQHNTNTVFNKIKKYSRGSEGYGWIAKMLDFKANIGNPRELQKYASGTMKNLSNAWFGDMRADAPTTADLEERVKMTFEPMLIENTAGNFAPITKETIGDEIAKEVARYYDNPGAFELIKSRARKIHHELGGGDKSWNKIEKDQNAHIALILENRVGPLGLAKTDAVKLFRMLLSDSTDPRVTGKVETRVPLNVPKPTENAGGLVGSPASGYTFVYDTSDGIYTNMVNLAKFMLGNEGFNGIKFANLTAVNAGGSGNTAKIEIYGGPIAPGNVVKTIMVPNANPDFLAKQIGKLAEEFAGDADGSDWVEWLQGKQVSQKTTTSKSPKPPNMPPGLAPILSGALTKDQLGILAKYVVSLETDLEFVDANLDNLPPSDIDKGLLFVKNTFPGIEKLTENKQMQLAKYLHDLGKWAADKLVTRTETQMQEDDAVEMKGQPTGNEDPYADYLGPTDDNLIAPGYSDENGNPMTVAQVAAGIKVYEPGSNDNHVYFTTNDGTAIQNPYEDETGNSIENPPIGPIEEGLIMKYWADQGVGPAVSEAALAIFDKANPGHAYKTENISAPEQPSAVVQPKPLLTAQQDFMMQAASLLMEGNPEVQVGGKKFTVEINKNGNATVVGKDALGNLIGTIPIQGSKNMEDADLEAKIYEALDALSAGAASDIPTAPGTVEQKITPAMINEAADALMNDDEVEVGGYLFVPTASGLGGTKVDIIQAGTRDIVDTFYIDPGTYREPSDMLDGFHDKITEFFENKPGDSSGPGVQMMPGDYALYGNKPFFIGVASLLDGKIEETHTAKEAENVDWHHTFLISAPVKERMESGESVLFWVDEDGKINLDSGQWWNEPIDPEDWRKILPEIQKQIKPNPQTSLGAQMMPGEQPVNRKAWMTPDGEIINVEPGSEHRFVARQFFPDAESDEKAQMAAEDEGYLRLVREGDRLTVGSMRTPNRFQLRELKNLAEENDYTIENDRGRSILGAQFMPAGSPMRAAAIRVGDKIFEGPMHMMVLDEIRKDQDIMKMFKNDDEFDEAMRDSDLIDSMDFMELSMNPPSEMKPKPRPLPTGLAQKVTFGFVDADGKFHNRREAMKISYGGEIEGPLFSEDLPPDSPASKYLHAHFMPAAVLNVPTQKTLDKLKKRLPKYEVEIADIPDYLVPDGVHISLKNVRGKVIGRATLAAEHPDYPQAIEVMGTSVQPSYRGKGYGEALYREIAKYAQSQGKKFMFAHTVSEDAARVRRKLFKEEKSRDGKWKKEGWPMLSRVGSTIQYMPGNAPGSFQDGPSLAEVTAPDVDRGPLSGVQMMPGYNPRYTDEDGNFDRELWLNDVRRAEAELRRRGYRRIDFSDEDWQRMIRMLLRGS